nr:MAG TPA: UL20 protein [Caudoviricetes sp.]
MLSEKIEFCFYHYVSTLWLLNCASSCKVFFRL